MVFMEEQKLLTIEQVAKYLQVSRSTIYFFMEQAENPLPYIQMSKMRKRFSKEAIDKWLINGGKK